MDEQVRAIIENSKKQDAHMKKQDENIKRMEENMNKMMQAINSMNERFSLPRNQDHRVPHQDETPILPSNETERQGNNTLPSQHYPQNFQAIQESSNCIIHTGPSTNCLQDSFNNIYNHK